MPDSAARSSWLDTQRLAFKAKFAGRLREALDALTQFIFQHRGSPLVADALLLRSSVYEDLRDFTRVREDLVSALAIAVEPTYLRFTVQLSLAVLDEQSGDKAAAREGYLRCLDIALREGKTSVGTPLQRLLAFGPDAAFTTEEQDLIKSAVLSSWSVLKLPGEPDLHQLSKTAEVLAEQQSRPR